jgi:hypothetical protein
VETKNLPKRDGSTRFLAFDFFHESTPYGFLIHTLNLGYHTPKKISEDENLSATVPVKPLQSRKHLVVKKYIISSYSTAKNMLKIADVKKNCDCGITELRLGSNISLKSSGMAIAEVLPSSCGIAIAD